MLDNVAVLVARDLEGITKCKIMEFVSTGHTLLRTKLRARDRHENISEWGEPDDFLQKAKGEACHRYAVAKPRRIDPNADAKKLMLRMQMLQKSTRRSTGAGNSGSRATSTRRCCRESRRPHHEGDGRTSRRGGATTS